MLNEEFASKWTSIIAIGLFLLFGFLGCVEMSKDDFGGPQAVGGMLISIGAVVSVLSATVLFPVTVRYLEKRGNLNIVAFIGVLVTVCIVAAWLLFVLVFGWKSESTYRGAAIASGLSVAGMLPLALLWWGLGKYALNK